MKMLNNLCFNDLFGNELTFTVTQQPSKSEEEFWEGLLSEKIILLLILEGAAEKHTDLIQHIIVYATLHEPQIQVNYGSDFVLFILRKDQQKGSLENFKKYYLSYLDSPESAPSFSGN